jgi:hypothetical protein
VTYCDLHDMTGCIHERPVFRRPENQADRSYTFRQSAEPLYATAVDDDLAITECPCPPSVASTYPERPVEWLRRPLLAALLAEGRDHGPGPLLCALKDEVGAGRGNEPLHDTV